MFCSLLSFFERITLSTSGWPATHNPSGAAPGDLRLPPHFASHIGFKMLFPSAHSVPMTLLHADNYSSNQKSSRPNMTLYEDLLLTYEREWVSPSFVLISLCEHSFPCYQHLVLKIWLHLQKSFIEHLLSSTNVHSDFYLIWFSQKLCQVDIIISIWQKSGHRSKNCQRWCCLSAWAKIWAESDSRSLSLNHGVKSQ